MQKKGQHLRLTAAIIVAMLVSGLLLAFIMRTTTLLTLNNRKAEEFLPAASVELLLKNPSTESIAQASAISRLLLEVPNGKNAHAIAQLQPTSGSASIMLFFKEEPTLPKQWVIKEHAPFFVAAKKKTWSSFPLSQEEPSLYYHEPYTTLQSFAGQKTPWLYAKRNVLPESASVSDAVMDAFVLTGVTHLSIDWGDIYRTVHMYPTQQGNTSVQENKPVKDKGAFISMRKHNITKAITQSMHLLSADQEPLLRTAIEQWKNSAFGTDVSVEYDLLPLLQLETSISLSLTGSGELLFTLQGEHSSEQQLTKTLERLHSSVEGTNTNTRIHTKELGKFTYQDVRLDAAHHGTEHTEKDEWTVRTTTGQNGSLLVSLQRGTTYILRNRALGTKTIDEQFVAGELDRSWQLQNVTLLGVGLINQQTFINWIAPYNTSSARISLLLGENSTWTYGTNGTTRSIRSK